MMLQGAFLNVTESVVTSELHNTYNSFFTHITMVPTYLVDAVTSDLCPVSASLELTLF